MIDVILIRLAFLTLVIAAAVAIRPFSLPVFSSLAIGLLCGIAVILVETRVRKVGLKQILGACAGTLTGAILGFALRAIFRQTVESIAPAAFFVELLIPASLAYLGLRVGLAKSDMLNLAALSIFGGEKSGGSVKILDTSVIIDGRIADIAETGILEGTLVVPQFVLRELQLVADSSDSMKRNRGRRGLDVLQRLQKMPRIDVQLFDDDFPNVKEVDLKLIELAKLYQCKIVTNDFNLNKVAQVHGVEVLNINELANALKPVVLPGETMRVFILKEGKEHNQGVAYLDDGTMVVVDNAKRHISKTVDVTVTSVLQTTAGKMIFGKYDERNQGHERQTVIERQVITEKAAPISATSSPQIAI